jgi:hypothetical protein
MFINVTNRLVTGVFDATWICRPPLPVAPPATSSGRL